MIKRFFIIIYLLIHFFHFPIDIISCTSAIIGADRNPYGRPLLWKNRDTSTIDNKIEFIKGKNNDFSYVALFNASDSLFSEAWMGMNEYGFAIMNTASYNLKNDTVPEKDMDKEGIIMTMALKKCKTVDDFANLIKNLLKPLGVEANFGVIDAYGDGAYFETDNYNYKRFNLADSENHILIRTNYSHSGRPDEGFGFVREANANFLLAPYIENKEITPEVFTEVLSHSFYHDLLKKDFKLSEEKWLIDQDFIPRYTSVASIVIEGCKPLASLEKINPEYISNEYIMWTALGYPPCAEVFPVKCSDDGVDDKLKGNQQNGHSQQCDLVLERKNKVFPIKKGNGNKYLDISTLFNEQGTGFLQILEPKNLEIYRINREKRDLEN